MAIIMKGRWQLSNFNVKLSHDLTARFGPAHGRYLHEAAQGHDDRPIITHWERKSLSRQITFQHDIRDGEFFQDNIKHVAVSDCLV
jgi:nucleotidyltransferase/DNA polymerase involved in DNA repair